MECLSHPNRFLVEHLKSVKQIGIAVYESKSNLHLNFAKKDIKTALSAMLFYHDIGKSTKFFQEYLSASIKDLSYKGKSDLKNHSLISAVYAAYKTYLSLDDGHSKSVLPIIVFLAIRKHHGDFDNIDDMLAIGRREWSNLKIQWDNLNFDCINKVNRLKFDDAKAYVNDLLFDLQDMSPDLNDYFLINFFFSILTYADKNDAKFHQQITSAALPKGSVYWVDEYKSIKFKDSKTTELNAIRNEIYNLSAASIQKGGSHNIFSINVPTGSGKTLAGINAALKLISKNNSLKKIIYALPFTSIIEQNYDEVYSILKSNNVNPYNYILKHHHLAEVKIKGGENDYSGQDAQFLIENWDKPIILTTFWQFFNTIISNKNKAIRKFHNIANSVIIVDEIQTMPIEYWKLIKKVLTGLTDTFNCKIIFMTATMPAIFSDQKGEIFPLIKSDKTINYFTMFSRYKVEIINNLSPITIDDFFDIAVKHISSDSKNSFMFVFNTIGSSLKFYKKLKEHINEHIIYLSGNIIPKDRSERIKQIKKTGRKIIVSTQLIEAGVDIDLDVVYRDFAPFESIVQAAGRCNRNNNHSRAGEVFVANLKDSKNNKRFCNYIYKPAAVGLTENLLKKYTKVNEGELLKRIRSYYSKIDSISSSDKSESIISYIQNLHYVDAVDKFKLIEDMPNTLVFVEKDDVASAILEDIKKILKIKDKWDQKSKFLEIKKDFYDYVLSVRISNKTENILKNLADFDGFKVITHEMISTFYDNNIGLTYEFNNFFT